MMHLDFETLKSEAIDQVSQNKFMVLATSANDRVTARMMSVINQELRIFFQVSVNSTKYQQIMSNPHVALCIGNMQIEGIAEINGQPLEIPYYVQNYPKVHEGSFKAYSALPCNRVVEVQPQLITFWKYDGGEPFRDFLDLSEQKAWRELYLENP